ncbi:MAG: hypothetical protein WCA76_10965, partial [Candidatus Sulfotelmatobacter sp.]
MSQATADIVGTTGANFTFTISAGTIRNAAPLVADKPGASLPISGNAVTITNLASYNKEKRMASGQRGTAKGIRVGSLTVCILAAAILVLAPLCLFGQSGGCTAGASMQNFYIDQNGNVTSTGRTSEGPACVQVYYNAFRFDVSVTSATSISAGPNLQSVTGSGPTAQTGGSSDELAVITPELARLDNAASDEANGVKELTSLLAFVDLNVGPGKAFPEAGIMAMYVGPKVPPKGAAGLRKALLESETLQFNFLPTDLAFGVCPSTPAANPAPGSILAKLQELQADATFYS